MATLASLVVDIKGNTTSLTKSLDRAEGRAKRFSNVAGKALKGFAVGGAAAIAGFAVASIGNFIRTGEELHKMAQRTGFSVEALSELKFAAEQSGSSLETIEKGSRTLSSAIFDANKGLATQVDAFEALGLNTERLSQLSPEEQFLATAHALELLDDSSVRAALAQDVFGRAGTELLPLFAQGEEGMAALRQQARDLGATFSTDAAASAAEFNDSLNELKTGFSGLGITLGEKVVPILTKGLDLFQEHKGVQIVLAGVVGLLAAALLVLGVRWAVTTVATAAQTVVTIAQTVATGAATIATTLFGIAINLALGPIGLIILAIAGIIAVVLLLIKNWDTIWPKIKGVWENVSGAIAKAWDTTWEWLHTTFEKVLENVSEVWDRIWSGIMRLWDTVTGAIERAYESNLGWLLPGGALLKALGFFQDNWDRIWGGIKSGFNAFISPIKNAIQGLIDLVGRVGGALGGIAGSVISGAGNFLGNIPGFQNGVSNFRGGLAVVGEGGPELVNLPRGSSVTPNGAGGVGNTVIINFNGAVYGGDDFDRRVNEARLRWQREGN